MNTSETYLEIMALLRNGRRWHVKQLADHFDIPRDEIRRIMDEIVAAGLPVAGDAQRGWQFTGLIDLPALTLTLTELNALQVALHNLLAEGYGNLAVAAGYVLDKIDAGLPLYLQEFDPDLHDDLYESQSDDEVEAEVLAQRAIDQQRRLVFRYVDADNARTRRTVRPLHVEGSGSRSKLVAWCELRADFRVFRLERTDQLEVGEPFDAEPGRTYSDYLRLQG